MTGDSSCTVCQRLERYVDAAEFAREAIREYLFHTLLRDDQTLAASLERLEKCDRAGTKSP